MTDATQLLQPLAHVVAAAMPRPRITILADSTGGTWPRVLVPISPKRVNRLIDLTGISPVDVVIEAPLQDAFRAREMAWLQEHRNELPQQYAGHWIALEGDQVIADSADLIDLLEQAREAGYPHPFVTMIPAGPRVPFYGCR
jgi:hypothetical protein